VLAVDLDIERREVEHLRNARIDHARNTLHHLQELLRRRVGALQVLILDLDRDRGGQTEIEHLAHDIGGLEVDGRAGELVGKLLAYEPAIMLRRLVRLVERDQHLAVGAADVVARHEGEVERTRNPDGVVDGAQLGRWDDGADLVLDRGHDLLGALKAVAARGAHMKLDDADVGGREEVGTDHRHERAGDRDQDRESAEDKLLAQQHRLQHPPIGLAETIKAAIEGT
jgi:hypothetical protein